MRCEEMAELLPAYAVEPSGSLAVRRHLSRCPGCRAELARYRALERGLTALGGRTVPPPPGLLAAREDIPRAQSGALRQVALHLIRKRSAYAGGLALAGLAAVTGALVWRSRLRRPAVA